MKRLLLAALAAVLLLPASASAHGCATPFDYEGRQEPPVAGITAVHTSCSTADEIVEDIRAEWQTDESLPRGPIYGSGKQVWRCTYQWSAAFDAYESARCKSRQVRGGLVTMEFKSNE